VFAGGCTLDAAEVICHADAEILESLVDKSLVRVRDDGEVPRFWMLETLNEFAREHLDASGFARAVETRHAEHYARLAERADIAEAEHSRAHAAAVEVEIHNLRVALERARAADHGSLVLRIAFTCRNLLGRTTPGALRQAIDDVLAHATVDPALKAGALSTASFVAYRQGELEAARQYGEDGLALAREAANDRIIGFCLNALAAIDVAEHRIAAARARYQEAEIVFSNTHDTRALAVLAANVADLEIQIGGYDAAASYANDALRTFTTIGDADGMMAAGVNLATANLLQGNPSGATTAAREALQIAAELGDQYGICCLLLLLATVAADRNDGKRAATLLGAANRARAATGDELEPTEKLIDARARVALALTAGQDAIKAAEERGGRIPLAEAIELALQLP
jgi:hypothetical protein